MRLRNFLCMLSLRKRGGLWILAKKKAGEVIKWHPAACVFHVTQADLDTMIRDIKENGQRVPGKAWTNPVTGEIEGIDGRIRASACEAIDIDFEYEVLNLSDDLEVIGLVNSLNASRRHLNQSQRAIIGARQTPLFSAAAMQRQLGGKANLPEGPNGQARDIVAKMLNVSGRLVQDGLTVLNKGCDDIIEAVESGKIAVSAAAIIAEKLKEDKAQQKIIVEMTHEEFSQTVKQLRAGPNSKSNRRTDCKENEPAEYTQEQIKAPTGHSGEANGEPTAESPQTVSACSKEPHVDEPLGR